MFEQEWVDRAQKERGVKPGSFSGVSAALEAFRSWSADGEGFKSIQAFAMKIDPLLSMGPTFWSQPFDGEFFASRRQAVAELFELERMLRQPKPDSSTGAPRI